MIQMNFRADQRQSQTLSPRLQHAVRLLQMSSLDFGLMIRETLGKNPFLEPDEGGEDVEGEALEPPATRDAPSDADNGADALEDRALATSSEDGDESDRDLFDHLVRRGNTSDRIRLSSLASKAGADTGWLDAIAEIALERESEASI